MMTDGQKVFRVKGRNSLMVTGRRNRTEYAKQNEDKEEEQGEEEGAG